MFKDTLLDHSALNYIQSVSNLKLRIFHYYYYSFDTAALHGLGSSAPDHSI